MSENTRNTYAGDLRELFTDEALAPTTPVYIYCPMHPDTRRPSMRVYEDGAYCFTCGAYMSRAKLIRHVEEVDPGAITGAKLRSSTRATKRAQPTLRREEREVLAKMAHDNLTMEQRTYYRERGFSDWTINTYRLGHYGSGYTLPVFETAEMTSVQTVRFRRDDALVQRRNGLTFEHPDKYWGLRGSNDVTVYPFPIAPEEETIILTEGEFDALLLRQEGLNAYSLTNGAQAWKKVKDWSALLPPGLVIKLCYDNDAAGIEASEAMSAALVAQGYQVTTTEYPADMPKDVSGIKEYDPQTFAEFVAGLAFWERQPQFRRILPNTIA